jgi:hypothetical protein
MHFVNSLERSKIFFAVRQMNLTGQQGGMVNLRLQVSTWMLNDAAAASGLPRANPNAAPADASPSPNAAAGEGE